MYSLQKCQNCFLPMISQDVWIGDDMIRYYVCPNCGGIKAESHEDEIINYEKKYIHNSGAYLLNGVKNEEKN